MAVVAELPVICRMQARRATAQAMPAAREEFTELAAAVGQALLAVTERAALAARAELARARRLNDGDRLLARLDARLGALDTAWKRADTKAFRALWQHYSTLDFDALVAED